VTLMMIALSALWLGWKSGRKPVPLAGGSRREELGRKN
jgi:hypothetical protein